MTKIIIEVGDEIKVDMQGFKGKKCLKMADDLTKLLLSKGVEGKQTEFKAKPEINLSEAVEYDIQTQKSC